MALRTKSTGPGEKTPLRGGVIEEENPEGATSAVRQSRRVQGMSPDCVSVGAQKMGQPETNRMIRDGRRAAAAEGAGDDDRRSVRSVNSQRSTESSRRRLLEELKASEEVDKLEEELENALRRKIQRKKELLKTRLAIMDLDEDLFSLMEMSNSVTSKDEAPSPVVKVQDWLRQEIPAVDEPFEDVRLMSIESEIINGKDQQKLNDVAAKKITVTGIAKDVPDTLRLPMCPSVRFNPVGGASTTQDKICMLLAKGTDKDDPHRYKFPMQNLNPPVYSDATDSHRKEFPMRVDDRHIKSQESMQPSTSQLNDTMLRFMDRMLSRQVISSDLPLFVGEVAEWPMFVTQFRRTTELLGLNDSENLVRLQKCLKGKARDAVLPILTFPENVPLILETLGLMFGRPDMIVKSMIKNIKIIEPPKESKPDSFILYSNMVKNLVATMKSLDQLGHMTNPQLLEEISVKLPYSLQRAWCKVACKIGDAVNLEDLSNWLADEANVLTLMPTTSY